MKDYLIILRVDHWPKNVFMVAGILTALILSEDVRSWTLILNVTIGIFATCLIASANYVINEILDAPTDRNHPTKQNRPIAAGRIQLRSAYIEYVLVAISGLLLASALGMYFFCSAVGFLFMGMIYNVRPIRSKELPFIDVLSESINNPIRLLLGWYATGITLFPPLSLLLSYWMIGAFFVAAKRLAEYRQIGQEKAVAYRQSFRYYDEQRLVTSLLAYASGFMFFFAIIIIKYHIELILIAPFLMFYLGYYLKMTYDPNSIVQAPELLMRKPKFIILNLALLACLVLFASINIPIINKLFGMN